MPADEKPHDADVTVADDADDGGGELPAGVQGMKMVAEGLGATVEAYKSIMSKIEHPGATKSLAKCMKGISKHLGTLKSEAHEHYPDHFEAFEPEPDEDDKQDDKPEDDKASDTPVDNEGDDADGDEDVSNVDKSLKIRKSWQKECQPHVTSLKDAAELLDDMSKSANIPSGYKRQCKGVMPGVVSCCSWISGKSVDTESTDEADDTKSDSEDSESADEAKVLQAIQAASAKAQSNAKILAGLKGAKR